MAAKQRIAILGGGIAGLTAAYELTEQPGWQDRYEITVYQLGWRLGGKGASGRNVSGPPGIKNRIEEHGLHIWLGFYENAFAIMQRCYGALNRPPGTPLARWDDAFKPHSYVGSYENIDGEWRAWMNQNPTSESLPGQGEPFPTPSEYLRRLLGYGVRMLGKLGAALTVPGEKPSPGEILHDVKDLVTGLPLWLKLLEEIREVIAKAERVVGALRGEWPAAGTSEHDDVDGLIAHVQRCLAAVEKRAARHDAARRAFIFTDIGFATLRGLIAEDLFRRGFDAIDDQEFSAWLRDYGATDYSLRSAFLRNTYDTVFGFVEGHPLQESLGAGTAVRSGLRMFLGYKGAFMWLMQAGMGDVVFTPLYQVLERRGVKFAFFHRIDALRLGAGRTAVERIELTRQIGLTVPKYDPLIDVGGLPCWPSEPRYEQLDRGTELRARAHAGENVNLESHWSSWEHGTPAVLTRGSDFDVVVLAIPVPSCSYLCTELVAANPKWADMVREIKTMRTMGAQVWLDRSLEDLGWPGPLPGAFGGFVRPLSTYADMSHLLGAERTPGVQGPKQLTYFCGPMPDSHSEPPSFTAGDFPATQTAVVHEETRALLRDHIRWVWPNFTWDMLADPENRQGEARLAAQYFRGNIDPSERYVLSVPRSWRYRLRSGESGFANVVLAGDWTYNGLNAGCIEAAVMSGMQAARVIDGQARTIIGETDGVPLSLPNR